MRDIEAIVLMVGLLGLMFGVIVGIRADLMGASDIFGIVVTILLFLYLGYALIRGEDL